MNHYKHIFFDLDRTIWDFETNSNEKFRKIYDHYDLSSKGIPSWEEFRKRFANHNEMLWDLYRQGKIKKERLSIQRFDLTLQDFGIHDPGMASSIAHEYLTIRNEDVYLFPDAIDVLDYLYEKYVLHLITNGFEEVQVRKVNISGLDRFFKTFTTSEEAGVKKPDPGIFVYALKKANADPAESIMIGDDLEVDILGAKEIPMDQVYFNDKEKTHHEKVKYEIRELRELKEIF